MADCTRCGRKLPALSFGKNSNLCAYCRQAERGDIQPGGHVSQLVPAWRVGPSVTMAIIAINVAVFLAMVIGGASLSRPTGQEIVDWGANFGPGTFGRGQTWRLLTSVFVHIGMLHLLVNMWSLWNLGRLAEQVYDKGTYLGSYLLCGIGASIAATWYQPEYPSAGASGAIFGLVGLLITTFWMGQLPIPAERAQAVTRSLVTVAAVNLLFGAAVTGISNSAHVGGLFTGLVLGGLMAPRLTRDPRDSRGGRWLIMAGATIALAILFRFAKQSFLAGPIE
jgi:rhomboid protease GluP